MLTRTNAIITIPKIKKFSDSATLKNLFDNAKILFDFDDGDERMILINTSKFNIMKFMHYAELEDLHYTRKENISLIARNRLIHNFMDEYPELSLKIMDDLPIDLIEIKEQ